MHGQALARGLGVDEFPAAAAVCSGSLETIVRHDGAVKVEALSSFLASFRDGSRCAAAVRLTPDTDLHKLKATQLKQLLAARSVSCPECVEKAEYVRRVREVYGLDAAA